MVISIQPVMLFINPLFRIDILSLYEIFPLLLIMRLENFHDAWNPGTSVFQKPSRFSLHKFFLVFHNRLPGNFLNKTGFQDSL